MFFPSSTRPLLDSEGNSFSDAHPSTGQGRSLDSLLKNEEPRPQLDVVHIDSEWDVPPFNYQTIDDIERVESSQQQTTPRRARSVTFDDIVRGLLQLPPAADELNMSFQMARDEEDNINNNIIDDNDEEALIIVDEPLLSDDAGEGTRSWRTWMTSPS
ncbi:hypothetical protein CEXT_553631 [Caerostris extrusa]|uniref:Uncharacterized protein n=1 Tax=Caerostris extrusa TaxID=172846 RepID=A0AAV4Q2C7_CAEEX|nr:hypothetical protein CEXT_553631 [Caerostris extrusa]